MLLESLITDPRYILLDTLYPIPYVHVKCVFEKNDNSIILGSQKTPRVLFIWLKKLHMLREPAYA